VLNAANEVAVRAFIEQRICLTDIPRVIELAMDQHTTRPALDLETVLKADREARLAANAEIEMLVKPSGVLAEHTV
jgi:1-deoxy-D-xylulose-5-phosphate reductoisomerase